MLGDRRGLDGCETAVDTQQLALRCPALGFQRVRGQGGGPLLGQGLAVGSPANQAALRASWLMRPSRSTCIDIHAPPGP